MGRKPKYTAAQKVWAAEQYLGGSKSTSEIAAALGMSRRDTSTIRQWGRLYKNNGPDIFINRPHNRSYSLEFKEQVCREYLSGKGSYKELAARHGISSHGVVRQWVKKYTGFSINGASLKPLKIQVVECHKKNNLNSRMRRNEKWQSNKTKNLRNR